MNIKKEKKTLQILLLLKALMFGFIQIAVLNPNMPKHLRKPKLKTLSLLLSTKRMKGMVRKGSRD